jgi:ribokinase
MKPGIPVAVVGSVNTDYSIFMKKLPKPGETVIALSADLFAGGKGLNQAVAVHRAGGDVKFHFSVGLDEDGRFLSGFLEQEQMDCLPLIDESLSTSKAYILVDESGENQISVVPGANYNPKLREFYFQPGSGLLVLQLEIGNENNFELAKNAKQAGWNVVLTPAPFSQFDPKLLEHVDVLTLNESEAMETSGSSSFIDAGRTLSQLVESVFVTRGSSGVAVFQKGELVGSVEAMNVESVDATGAGDTFCGYLVAGLAQGFSNIDAAKLGTIAAGLSVQTRGASNSIPLRAKVDEIFNKLS